MGTRADFYVRRGEKARWVGSIAYDGHPETVCGWLKPRRIKNARDFLTRLNRELKSRDDATFPKDGWPWPWDDSHTSDYAYAFDQGVVWVDVHEEAPWQRLEDAATQPTPEHFDMSEKRKMAPAGSSRSGVMVFGQ